MTCRFCGGEAETDVCEECDEKRKSLLRKGLPPCKDCGGRAVGCHGKCGYYAEYRAQTEQIRSEQAKASEVQNYRSSAHQKFINDICKRNRRYKRLSSGERGGW